MRPIARNARLISLLGLVLLLGACVRAAAPATRTSTEGQPSSGVPSPSITGPTATPQAALRAGDVEQELRESGIRSSGWSTNFSKRTVPLTEISSGGPPKDGIPAIDRPTFVSVREAEAWLAEPEPVLSLVLDGNARAYPLQMLIWHEIVNDVVAGTPVAVTYCPLCNTAIVFKAALDDGRALDFGTTGNLRFSDLVMYDRQTESWWQQASGEAIVGELAGTRLKMLPSTLVSWREFKRAYPSGTVLSRETGYQRDYGRNPYVGYDSGQPFLFSGPIDGRLRATERVATVVLGRQAVAFPFTVLEQEAVVHYSSGDQRIVVLYKKGTASPLDSSAILQGRDVGSTGVFRPTVNGQGLTFHSDGEHFRDEETGTVWNILGQAIDGPLAGQQMEPVVHANHFWFAWAAFEPETVVYQGKP